MNLVKMEILRKRFCVSFLIVNDFTLGIIDIHTGCINVTEENGNLKVKLSLYLNGILSCSNCGTTLQIIYHSLRH